MATFTNLFFASDALRNAIAARVQQAGVPQVLVGAPPVALATGARVTVTLLMVNEEPSHKNDDVVRNPNGTTVAPPTSLSATYLVTTEGQTVVGDMADAHQYLGEILQLFHDAPFLDLGPNIGRLNVGVVPMTPDLMEKVFTPLQAQHRPFAVFEVWPIQLETTLPIGGPRAVVRPGGVNLAGPTPAARPRIGRIYPRRIVINRSLRIDGPFPKAIEAVVIGNHVLRGAALGVVPGLGLDEAVRVLIDPALLAAGAQRVHVITAGNLASEAEDILIEPLTTPPTPSTDAPNFATFSLAAPPLVLFGDALAQATRIHVWPDAGVSHPSDVRDFPAVATPSTVTATLVNLPPGAYRVTVELSPGPGLPSQFTPYVILEVVP